MKIEKAYQKAGNCGYLLFTELIEMFKFTFESCGVHPMLSMMLPAVNPSIRRKEQDGKFSKDTSFIS